MFFKVPGTWQIDALLLISSQDNPARTTHHEKASIYQLRNALRFLIYFYSTRSVQSFLLSNCLGLKESYL